MKVVLKDNDYEGKNIHFIEKNKILTITFMGNGDLYWIINNPDCKNNCKYSYDFFEITKENYQVYWAFEKLLTDIKDINIFAEEEINFPSYLETDEEKRQYMETLELNKKNYRKFNKSYYNDLYDEEKNTVTWVSDEAELDFSNKVSIKKLDDRFVLEFFQPPQMDEDERENLSLGAIGIRFRNSGSRYEPFNVIFMRMFQNLQNVDDVNDYGHQINIEEYLYNKKLVKK